MFTFIKVFMVVVMLGGASSVARGSDPDPNAVRTVVNFRPAVTCTGDAFSRLLTDYYTNGEEAAADLTQALLACKGGPPGVLVVLFPASPTAGATSPSLVHLIVRQDAKHSPPTWTPVAGLNGVTKVDWVYLTNDACDIPIAEVATSPVENPLIAQVGALVKTVIPAVGGGLLMARRTHGAPAPSPCPKPSNQIFYAHYGVGSIPFTRSTLSENDYVETVSRNEKGEPVDSGDDKKVAATRDDAKKGQLSGTTSFLNTPPAYVTFHAAAGLFAGRVRGARQMKIDSGAFVSDPASRLATMAGVAWHRPFDSTRAVTTAGERVGLLTAATLTPGPGFFFGPNVGWRGFGFVAGWGIVWIKSGPRGTAEGDPAGAGAKLVFRPATGLIVGATYSFGG